jgi:hypothetical protein
MQAETIVKAGTGSQLQNLSRWGDYSAMTVDPVDDCTFWYTSEYLKTNGTWNWSTWITSFKFPNCGVAVAPDFTIAATPSSRTVTAGTGTTYAITVTKTGGAADVSLAASGMPAGVSGSFTLNPASSTSTFSVSTTAATVPDTYPITITGTSGSVTHPTTVNLVVAPQSTVTVPGAPAPPIVAPANGKGVNVSWSAPANNGGSAITGYKVYRRTSSTSLAVVASLGNVTSFKDTTTARGVSYYYAVSAVNVAGESPPSAAAGPVRAK